MQDKKLMNDVIYKNHKMGKEIKNITAPNGKILSGIIAGGWGSIAQIAVDGDTGDIKNISRVPTKDDE